MVKRLLPRQCAAAKGHHVVTVAKGTGRTYHFYLGAGSLQIGQGGLSVGGASREDGLRVGGQGVGRGPSDDGFRLTGSKGMVSYKKTVWREVKLLILDIEMKNISYS